MRINLENNLEETIGEEIVGSRLDRIVNTVKTVVLTAFAPGFGLEELNRYENELKELEVNA